MWTWLDLILFTGTVYGLSWILTKSKLFERPREAVKDIPFIGYLAKCIVCTSVWVSLGLVLLLPWTGLFSEGFRVHGPVDVLVIVGWTVAASWGLARLLGDAE